jgi:hypothetical protein
VIPKVIHYNWFGGKPHSDLLTRCIESWQRHLPDYRIVCWNEGNVDISQQCAYVREAYAAGRYAFVSDYIQAWALGEHGGIYIDSDVEVMKSLDQFLEHRAFIGFQESGLPFTALWGCEKDHPFATLIRREYESRKGFVEEINTTLVSRLLVENYNVKADMDAVQRLADGLVLYPSDYFCVDFDLYHLDEHNHARHHFNTSWIKSDEKPSHNFYKEFVYKKHVLRRLCKEGNIEITINNIVENLDNELLLKRIGKRQLIEFLLKDLFRLGKKKSV